MSEDEERKKELKSPLERSMEFAIAHEELVIGTSQKQLRTDFDFANNLMIRIRNLLTLFEKINIDAEIAIEVTQSEYTEIVEKLSHHPTTNNIMNSYALTHAGNYPDLLIFFDRVTISTKGHSKFTKCPVCGI